MEYKTIIVLFLSIILLVLFHLKKREHKPEILLSLSILLIGYFNFSALVFVLVLSAINFYLVGKISNSTNSLSKNALYLSALFLNVGIFLFYRIEDLLHNTINFEATPIIFAIGISFYTLNNLAFIVDSYKKTISPQVSFQDYLLSNVYFPKFLSGPIIHINEFSSQLKNLGFRSSEIGLGIKRITFGLVKKMVIADRLAEYIIYNFDVHPHLVGLTNLVVVLFYTIQLYFDFSGYSDIAIGFSRIFGFKLPENFNFPFKASSITEFWRRWHCSLTAWLSKYIYFPISYRTRKHGVVSVVLALFTTFLVSGIWHGLHLSLIIYAMIHATFMVVEYLITKAKSRETRSFSPWFLGVFGKVYVFLIVSLSFVFLRTTDLGKAIHVVESIFKTNSFLPKNYFDDFIAKLATGGELDVVFNFYTTLSLMLFFLIFENRISLFLLKEKFSWPFLIVCVLLVALFGQFVNRTQFIYSQF